MTRKHIRRRKLPGSALGPVFVPTRKAIVFAGAYDVNETKRKNFLKEACFHLRERRAGKEHTHLFKQQQSVHSFVLLDIHVQF